MLKLLLLFVLVPLVELWILIETSQLIGIWPTILIVIATGIAGTLLAKLQGLAILYRLSSDLARGILPGSAMFDGVCILMGGAFLLTPGFLTDLCGFALLIPGTRRVIVSYIRRYLQRKLNDGTLQLWWH
ncbi:MAG TPA: FxsA family protein [Candidatus Limnocylindrales bacterium]|nr:FxsA family protein [Candidatus Limnocylindrales bacterium]